MDGTCRTSAADYCAASSHVVRTLPGLPRRPAAGERSPHGGSLRVRRPGCDRLEPNSGGVAHPSLPAQSPASRNPRNDHGSRA